MAGKKVIKSHLVFLFIGASLCLVEPRLATALEERDYVAFESAKKWLTHFYDHPKAVGGSAPLQHIQALGATSSLSLTKALESERETLVAQLWIAHGSVLAGQKSKHAKQAAKESWLRGLNGLNVLRWPLVWKSFDSDMLARILDVDLARRVVDAFPKAAQEVESLRKVLEKTQNTSPVGSELRGERLTQAYSERRENDEDDFGPILDAFLNEKTSKCIELGKEYVKAYPKSALRFRVFFLMGESYLRENDPESAKIWLLKIIESNPLSIYTVPAAFRLGKNLSEFVKREPLPLVTDPRSEFKDQDLLLPYAEAWALRRAQAFLKKKQNLRVEYEIGSLVGRSKNLSSVAVLKAIRLAHAAQADLVVFRFTNELVQRQDPVLWNESFLKMIFPIRFESLIQAEAQKNKVDPRIVMGLMKQESGFSMAALSLSGAIGLMQLMPFTALDVEPKTPLAEFQKTETNVRAGTKYLGDVLNKFGGNVAYALAGYNAGPYRVVKWRKEMPKHYGPIDFIESIPIKEPRDYVWSILRNRTWYHILANEPVPPLFDFWVK